MLLKYFKKEEYEEDIEIEMDDFDAHLINEDSVDSNDEIGDTGNWFVAQVNSDEIDTKPKEVWPRVVYSPPQRTPPLPPNIYNPQ